MKELGLVIPLLNEARSCARVTRSLVRSLEVAGIPHQLLLVDNGSRDGTGAIVDDLARALPSARALHLADNAGYGGGILAGLAQLRTPWLGWHWGDGQVKPEVVVQVCQRMATGQHACVKARRVRRRDGLQRLAVSSAYNGLARVGLGLRQPDLNGCPKVFTRQALARLAPRSRGWLLDLEVMLGAEQARMPITSVPAVMHPRREGRSKVSGHTLAEFARGIWHIKRGRPPWED